jgi:hypothetical protein
MRRLVIILALPVMLVGCGVSTSEQAFDPALIRDVGRGSTALAAWYTDVIAQEKAARSFNQGSDQATTNLLYGRLNKLTVQDLIRIANANRTSHTRFVTLLRALDKDAKAIKRSQVDPRPHSELSSGAKRFITTWNDYLASSAAEVRRVEQATQQMEPAFNDLQAMLKAAYETSQPHSTVQYRTVRDRAVKDIVSRVTGAQDSIKHLATTSPAQDHRFYKAVVANQDGLAVAKKAASSYPNGWLAKEFQWPS